MTGVPGYLMRHTVSIEPYSGDGAYGPTYEEPTPVKCLLDEQTRMVRDKDGRQVSSTSTAYCPLSTTAPPGSKATLPDGRVTFVIAALRRDSGGPVTPNHLEVQLQ